MNYGVVDIGSNSLRLLLFSEAADFSTGLLASEVICLGEEVAVSGYLRQDRMREAIRCCERFQDLMEAAGVLQVKAYCTQAVREAKNGRDFVKTLQSWFPWNVRILSGAEEAELGWIGTRAFQPEGEITIIDIGGGSTEIVGGSDQLDFRISFPYGSLKMAHGMDPSFLRAMEDLPPLRGRLIGLGGSIRSLVTMECGKQEASRHEVHAHVLERKGISETLKKLESMSLAERKNVAGLDPGRVESVLGGLRILEEWMKCGDWQEIMYSDYGNLEGYALREIIWKNNELFWKK